VSSACVDIKYVDIGGVEFIKISAPPSWGTVKMFDCPPTCVVCGKELSPEAKEYFVSDSTYYSILCSEECVIMCRLQGSKEEYW
jgi:hypothetical protein